MRDPKAEAFGTIIFFGVDNLNSFANCVCLAGENSFRFSSVSDLSLPILHASIAISSYAAADLWVFSHVHV